MIEKPLLKRNRLPDDSAGADAIEQFGSPQGGIKSLDG